MWRPDDWKNPHTPMQKNRFVDLADAWFRDISDKRHRAYEAGADAMLEALRKGATRVNNIGDVPKGKGVIVFIPEEAE